MSKISTKEKRGGKKMLDPIINQLKSRMDKEVRYCVAILNNENLAYVVLKKKQICSRYLRLMQTVMRRKWA